jgi:hypothetical protein
VRRLRIGSIEHLEGLVGLFYRELRGVLDVIIGVLSWRSSVVCGIVR